jgi:hypothetical protein
LGRNGDLVVSLGARVFLGIFCFLVAAMMFLIAPDDENRMGFFGIAIFAAAAAVFLLSSGRLRDFLGSCVGLTLFALGLWYLAGQLDAGEVYSGSRSRPSITNAILFIVVFGLPGLLFAAKARFGFRKVSPKLCVQAHRGDRS